MIQTVMRHDQIALDLQVPENLPKIKCRSQQIQQVVMNLLTNARDALNERFPGYDDNKIIRITAVCLGATDSPPEESASEAERRIRLTVEDHGFGIPEDVRERMFEPFYTTKPRDRGTGLGLAISHGIVKDHGGELSVECEPGEWTRIHIDLPIDNGWELE